MNQNVGDILNFLHEWAPPHTAQSWDNVGLQIGRKSASVTRGLIALDATPGIVEEARRLGAQLLITHHPLLFKPLTQLTDSSFASGVALMLAESGISLIASHTNLDAARTGVSFALAESLGLQNVRFLTGLKGILSKFVVYVPPDYADVVRTAAHHAGAGRIGDYSHCSFSSGGTGQFKPGDSASPFLGERSGPIERVQEVRIEMEVLKGHIAAVLAAVKQVHPYEEVAYDLIPLDQEYRDAGLGAVGTLPVDVPLSVFLRQVCVRLKNPSVRYAGTLEKPVRTVAVCGGSGSDFIQDAQRAGADVFVTGDVTYHRYFDVLNAEGFPTMALVDAGHYETESMIEDVMVTRLSKGFPSIAWQKASIRSSPVHTFV